MRRFAFVILAASSALAQPAGTLTLPAPITRWDDAIPLGDGLLGGLVWGEGNTIRLSLDRGDLWDERTPEMLQRPDWTYSKMIALKEAHDHKTHQEMFDVPYDTVPYPTKLPGGRVEFTLGAACQVRSFSLALGEAEARAELSEGEFRGFYDAAEPVALFRITGAAPSIRIIRPGGLDKLGNGPAEFGSREADAAPGTADRRMQWMTQRTQTGLEYTVAVGSSRTGDETLVAVSIAAGNAADSRMQATARIDAALAEGYEPRRARHAKWWSDFWGRSSVSIPDAGLQRHYDLCKYFYGAASAPDAPPIPLQGVWTCDNGDLPPWKGDYHNDLNTQMTYLAYPAAGLFEQGMSWLNFNTRLLQQYRSFARGFYGVGGAVVPGVMTISGKPMGGWGQYSLSPTHSAWVAQAFYLHWRYTRDEKFLREVAYPFCSAVGEALHALLKPDAAGHLRLPLSSSPEIYDNSYKAWLPPNSNYDLALLRFIFAANAEMAKALGPVPGPDLWAAALSGLEPFDTDPATGSLTFARGFPFNTSHRHFSHAMAIHPLGLLTVDGSDEDRRTIGATLEEIEKQGTSAWCGYSFSWFAAMNARAGRGEKALEYLKKYERGFIGPNGFHLNGDQSGTGLSSFTYRPFTLEGNFLAMAAVQEMLLQSWRPVGEPGRIRVFPATPDAWKDVSFNDLRAEGAVRVSARRREGRTEWVRLATDAAGTVRMVNPFAGPVTWTGPAPVVEGVLLTWTVPKGAVIEGSAK